MGSNNSSGVESPKLEQHSVHSVGTQNGESVNNSSLVSMSFTPSRSNIATSEESPLPQNLPQKNLTSTPQIASSQSSRFQQAPMHLSPLPFNTGMSQKSQNQQSKNNLPPQSSQQHQSSLTALFQPVVDREPLDQLVTQSQQVLSSEHQQQQLQYTELVSRTSSAHVPATENDARQSQHINNAGFTKRRQPSMVNYKENQQEQLQSHQPKCQGNPLDTLSLPEATQSLPGGAQLKLPSSSDQSGIVAAFKAIQQCSFQDMLHHPDVPPVIHPSPENNTVHQNADRQTTDSNTYQNVNNQSAASNITYQNVDNQNAASNTTYQNVNNQSAASNTTC